MTSYQLHTLEDLIAYNNELDDDRRASLFEFGDLIGEYVAAHLNGNSDSPAAVRSLCRAIVRAHA